MENTDKIVYITKFIQEWESLGLEKAVENYFGKLNVQEKSLLLHVCEKDIHTLKEKEKALLAIEIDKNLT